MKVSVVGGSGYVGGELLRLLIHHPHCELQAVTSQRFVGEPIYRVHPNFRNVSTLHFRETDLDAVSDSDLVFSCLPHGKGVEFVTQLHQRGQKVIDLSADFRLKEPRAYQEYYGFEHKHPELLKTSVCGLPELHRDEIKNASLVAIPGCMATAAILGLAPLVAANLVDSTRIVVDAKIGSSGAGITPSAASHHSERSGGVRPYKPTGHRHTVEIEQELALQSKAEVRVAFTPHAVGMVRGILATSHTFQAMPVEKKDVWKTYRSYYANEPFIRMVSDNKGLYGLPNPKADLGTNFCDIGFEIDEHARRLVVFTSLDNLTKGAAGQAVQAYNIINGVDERTALDTVGLHP